MKIIIKIGLPANHPSVLPAALACMENEDDNLYIIPTSKVPPALLLLKVLNM